MADPPIIIHEADKLPDFTQLNDLASQAFGSCILFATDDWFATAENLLKPTAPEWLPDEFTEYGKWMDGWETRRKRIPGHDWCIIQLGSGGIIGGFDVDTSYFTGNFAPKVSIQAASLHHDFQARPTRKMGTAATPEEFKDIEKLKSESWETILPIKQLGPGYKTSCHNFFSIENPKRYTHLRVNIYPDGGIARLRVYGTVRPDWQDINPDRIIDLVAMSNGGACVGYSNKHYGHPRNMIAPGRARIMAEGWETARRMDRPEVLRAGTDGALIVPGKEWAEFKLGTTGIVTQIEIDTNHFKGNFPDSCYIEACLFERKKDSRSRKHWRLLLPKQKLSAHKRLFYSGDEVKHIGPVNHVRVTIAPDGGISRLRLWGYRKTPSKL